MAGQRFSQHISDDDCSILCSTELVAVLVTIEDGSPHVVTVDRGAALPSGPLTAAHHSLQKGMQNWVRRQTGIALGHTEQLYTFTSGLEDACRQAPNVRISYMAVLKNEPALAKIERHSFYDFFPWEDRRTERARQLLRAALAYLKGWAGNDHARRRRVARLFGLEGERWNDELVLARYELLWESGCVPESTTQASFVMAGTAMKNDFRRILATALSRLRSKIRYTSVIFDFLPHSFTLFALQKAMEALSGRCMRKQNFRRLVLQQHLVHETGNFAQQGQGRPARLYQFSTQNGELCDLTSANLPLPSL